MKPRVVGYPLIAASVIGLMLSSCSSIERTVVIPPAIEGASFVGNKSCLECHPQITRAFPASPHSRLHYESANMRELTGCESCHGPGSRHVAVGGGRRLIHNPGKDPKACFNCHLQTHAEFNLPQHHPVLEGKMNCVQCHDPHGMDIMKPARGLAMARLNESCSQCHREQTKPHVFEHEALREGCTSCHQPHGSINAKMLVERDNNLCLKCHAQMPGPSGEIFIGKFPHKENLRFGTCYSAGCHTAVHGSNVDSRLRY
jgi:predicted CXXCH cytochrome family protein